jgi:hypothetical protein
VQQLLRAASAWAVTLAVVVAVRRRR